MVIVSIGLCRQLTTLGRKLLSTHMDATSSNSMMRLPPFNAIQPATVAKGENDEHHARFT